MAGLAELVQTVLLGFRTKSRMRRRSRAYLGRPHLAAAEAVVVQQHGKERIEASRGP